MNRSHSDHRTIAWRRSALTVFGLGTAALTVAAQGQVRFGPPVFVEVPRMGSPGNPVFADFNGDGWTDLALLGHTITPNLYIYLNEEGRRLVPALELPTGGQFFGRLVVGDVDGDGHLDLVWRDTTATTPGLRIFYNRGDGRGGEIVRLEIEADSLRRFAIADIDGNGRLDIIYSPIDSPEVWALFNRGRNEFEEMLLYTHPAEMPIVDLAVGDIDGDSDVDIALLFARGMYDYYQKSWVARDSELVLLFNDGSGGMSESLRAELPWRDGHPFIPYLLAMGDFDGDGDLDFVIAARENHGPTTATTFINRGSELMQSQSWIFFGTDGSNAVDLADLDLDGRLDIAVLHEDFHLHVVAGLGEGRFAAQPQRFDPGLLSPTGFAFGDLRGTGQWDAVVTGSAGIGRRGFSVAPNLSFTQGPWLHHGSLTRGRPATFAVRDAEPGERVHFLYSLTGAGHTRGQPLLGGIVLDLLDPIVHFGSATADANGNAVLRLRIPPTAPLTTVTTQAVIRRGPGGEDSVKTPFRTARIEE